jgi:hypothetical protein
MFAEFVLGQNQALIPPLDDPTVPNAEAEGRGGSHCSG